jgi:hypothetical protein
MAGSLRCRNAWCFFLCNVSRNGIATQVAWNISLSSLSSSQFFLQYKLQQLLMKVEFASTFGNDCYNFSIASCRHFSNLCPYAIATQVAEKIASRIRTFSYISALCRTCSGKGILTSLNSFIS